ncbi:MAG: mechanosensitive ion channel family protein [Okeania sp. SIO2C9]|uniref:mechanosensitive ion channel family protein n=1 Tax=Okeania sp. SIO2C9 TaxID=2607791 RepID=UPI0013C0BE1A|nr:mechanosensitive ion channel family protein [Okeania sp. SIO2C9]NEQ74279.1 mechanosensitive ion channel family protein [Okeania sp. SIO2C9]
MHNIIKYQFIKNFQNNMRAIASKNHSKINSVVKFILVTLLTFGITITWSSLGWAQIPFLPNIQQTENQGPIFDWFNRPYKCGNLMCSKVWFNGRPLITVAAPSANTEENQSAISTAKQRAKTVEINLQQVLKIVLQSKNSKIPNSSPPNSTPTSNNQLPEKPSDFDQPLLAKPTLTPKAKELQTRIQKITPNIDIIRKDNINSQGTNQSLNLHPQTPKIEVGTLNNLTVIYAPEQPGLTTQTILTVTKYDVVANFANNELQLANIWQNRILQELSNALKEREYYKKKLYIIIAQVSIIIASMIIISSVLKWIQKRLKAKIELLKQKIKELEQSLQVNPEEKSIENYQSTANTANTQAAESSINFNKESLLHSNLEITSLSILLAMVENAPLAFLNQLEYIWSALPKVSLKRQFLLKKQKNITVLLEQILMWAQVFIWVGGISLIVAMFPQTRALYSFLLTQYVQFLLIWVIASITDKATYFLIDFWLDKWATQAQQGSLVPERYTMRVNTYSGALKQATSVVIYSIAILFTVQAIGISLAGIGIIGITLTYVFKAKVDNLINGCLILWTDQYAVGDVVQIGNVTGLVEHINLYLTQLRGAEGRLITIPNGSFEVVQNLTKDWSRVDFRVEIAYSADARKALNTIEEVSEQMRNEPEWQDKILEPAIILGVDNISHTGILIQIWIKTAPIQQFAVGREFRLRIKQAFDQEGIAIGVPQQSVNLQNYPNNTNSDRNKGDNSYLSALGGGE